MSISVGNLSLQVTQLDLTQAFAKYGVVKRIQMPIDQETGRLQGSAFIQMETKAEESAAIAALDGADQQGQVWQVNHSNPDAKRSSFAGSLWYFL